MTDAKLRGKLLKVFYDRRHNAEGWVPTSDVDLSGGELVDRQTIGSVCRQLADANLIRWKPLSGAQEGLIIGMAQITAFGVDVIEGTARPPIAIDIVGLPPSGIDLYDSLLADAKKLGPDEAKLVELVGRERAEPLLGEAIGRQATSSFVTDLHGVRKIPRNFFDLIETELRRFEVAAISPTIPDQSPAPVRVEERDGRITRVSDRDSPLRAVERDFNAWREPILEHVRELLENNFREGTNHGRARDRLVALSKLLPGEIADVKERQFRIGYEIERLDGLIVAYRSGADDMPIFDIAVLEDLDRLRIALKMGVDRLERWSEFRRAATNDPARDGDADRDAVGDALEQLADRMDERQKYFDADLPVTFRFLAEAVRDPRGATKTVVYGAVRSAENLISFLGQKSLGIGRNAVEGVEQHISKAVAALLIVVLGEAALRLSGALPEQWTWLRSLLDALGKREGD